MRTKRLILCAVMGCLVLAALGGETGNQGLSLASGKPAGKIPQAALGDSFSYQGRLLDGGSPANGTYDFEFKLYDDPSAGIQMGTTGSKDDVTVTDGLFIVELDFGTAFDGTALYLEIGVRPGASSGAYTTLSPRQALNASPNALYSKRAPWSGLTGVPSGFADGVDDTDDTVSWSEISGIVGTGANEVAAGDHDHWGASWTGTGTTGLTLQSLDDKALRAQGIATGVDAVSDSEGGKAVWATELHTTGANYGVYGRTYSTAGHGVYGYASQSSGTTYGVYGKADSSSGTGVYGYTNYLTGTTYGVYGKSDSSTGRGVTGEVTHSTGANFAVYGTSISSSGTGVYGKVTNATGATYGVRGESNSTTGYGVHGSATAGSGTNYGVYGRSDSTDGRGVMGNASASSGQTCGVYGYVNSTTGMGVYGNAAAASGENVGVYGRTGSASGYGVYAENASGVALRVAGSGVVKSTADIEIAVSPLKMVVEYGDNVQIRPHTEGYIELQPNVVSASQNVHVPVDIPSVLFGTPLKLKSIRVRYKCTSATSYVDETQVRYVTDSGSNTILLVDGSNYTSTSWSTITITDATPDTIDGSLFVYFSVYFANTGSDQKVYIGRITLTFTEE